MVQSRDGRQADNVQHVPNTCLKMMSASLGFIGGVSPPPLFVQARACPSKKTPCDRCFDGFF